MKLIIGLGNSGTEYLNTRHNVGFLVVDELKKHKSSNLQIYKSTNFMNESGSFVLSLYTKYNIQNTDLYIIHDDLDIKLGEYKIQFGRGPKDHNGILDIEDKLGTKDFWRVRVGVDNRPQDNKPMGLEYVLQNFSDEERTILDRVILEICKKLASI
jgi:PTH1 family peptidyl-tRNA hydrolase